MTEHEDNVMEDGQTVEAPEPETPEPEASDMESPEFETPIAELEVNDALEDISADDSPVVKVPMDKALLRKIVEGVLMAAGQPMADTKIAELFENQDNYETPSKEEIRAALEDIQADCAERGFELKEVGSGWRFQVRAETAPWVNRLWDEKPQKYSRALLETLSLIAYRQPITRGDIEEIRGVAVSSHIVKTLSEREWIKVVGHRDVPGRPSLYATTRQFLDYFNLKSLDELPSLSELRDIEELDKELNNELDLADDEDTEEAEGIKEAVAESAERAMAEADLFDDKSDLAQEHSSGEESIDAAVQDDELEDDFAEPAFDFSEDDQTESDVSAIEPTEEDPNAV